MLYKTQQEQISPHQKTQVISIITVTYNARKDFIETLTSIKNQTYPFIEYVVIDGNSSDGTQSIVKSNLNIIDKWISEPDKGIYDAMNKGLNLATGDFVFFLNAGDLFYDKDTLEKIVQQVEPNTDILYGETMMINAKGKHLGTRSQLTTRRLPKQLTWQNLKKGMVVCHQSILVKRTLATSYLIDNLSADIDWVINALKNSKKITNTNLIVSKFLIGGVSKQKHKQSLFDRWEVMQNHFGLPATVFSHIQIIFRAIYFQFSHFGKEKYQ